MSEIEKIKLYQNAGIEPTYTDECIIANRYWEDKELANEYGTFDKFMEKNCKFGYQDCTDECEYAYTKTHYPPFTAEKQIELICFLLNADIKIDICKEPNMKMEICDIAEALAEVTNTIWQDLTPEEKQQVKEILNG